MDSVARDNGLVERKPGLRAIPRNEFIDGVAIAALRFRRPQTGKHGCFDLLQIRKPELCFVANGFLAFRLAHDWPPPKRLLWDCRKRGSGFVIDRNVWCYKRPAMEMAQLASTSG